MSQFCQVTFTNGVDEKRPGVIDLHSITATVVEYGRITVYTTCGTSFAVVFDEQSKALCTLLGITL